MNNFGKTSEKTEGKKVNDAEEAAARNDRHQPKNRTTGKNASESEGKIT